MTTNSDDLEKQLQQNLKLRRELGAEVAKARDSNAKQRGNMASVPETPHQQPAKVTTTEGRLEQQSDAQRREASRAGLLVTVLFVLLAAVALLAVGFWPVFMSTPITESAPKAE
jgi:cobalamin biosynthesis Mg chelatase CobN